MDNMNIELTTKCPLKCPQCYCTLEGGKDIDKKIALYWISEGVRHGVKEVMLSGGETLCYPFLFDIISGARSYGVGANIAISGFHFSQEIFLKLVNAGVTGIFVSLNGSTEEINSLTRDGFDLAINALHILKSNGYSYTTINWVMHSNNSDDFCNIIALAEKYAVANLTVMAVKPDSKKELRTLPSKEQMISVNNIIKSYNGPLRIYVESCFSPLLALFSETKLFGNFNIGKNKGCGAGRTTFSVNVDGMLSPCRHLDYFEKFDNLDDYLNKSLIQQKIRGLEESRREPCAKCKYCNYCRHCLAINSKTKNDLFIGFESCPIYESV